MLIEISLGMSALFWIHVLCQMMLCTYNSKDNSKVKILQNN